MKKIAVRIVIVIFFFVSFFSFRSLKVSAQTPTDTAVTTQDLNNLAQSQIIATPSPTPVTIVPNQQSFDNLPNPTLLPDSPFYFLKRWGENIQTFFTIDDYQKAQLQLNFAQVRLEEAKAELEKNNTNLTDQMLSDYNKDIQSVSNTTQKLSQEGKEVTGLIDTIKDREQTRLAVLNNELTIVTNPVEKQKIQQVIKFTRRQSQTNINRLVHAVTHTPNYLPNPNQTVSGQVTSINSLSFTIQTQGNKTFSFTTDPTTVFKLYGSTSSGSLANLTVGTYVQVVFPKVVTTITGTVSPSTTPIPTQAIGSNPLAKEVVFGIPQNLVIPLVGTIVNFAPNSFTLQTSNGQIYTVNNNMQTIYRDNTNDANAHQFRSGTQVRVYAIPMATANTYLAKIIYVVFPKRISRTGTIQLISGSTITVTARNGITYTFTLNGNTIVQKNNQPDSSSDIAVNQLVTVWYEGSATDTSAVALRINIQVKGSEKLIPTVNPTVVISVIPTVSLSPTP